ncbi:MAG TPA: hypothetical protein VGH79_07330 [Gaiellaceae bacterium]
MIDAEPLAPPRLQMTTLVVLSLLCAIPGLLLGSVTHGWSYDIAPVVAAIATGVRESRRSDATLAFAYAVGALVLTGLFMLLGALIVGVWGAFHSPGIDGTD